MIKLLATGLLVVGGLWLPSTSSAQQIEAPLSAIWLSFACDEYDTSDYARGFCDGAIDAIYSTMSGWCVPSAVSHGEVQRYVREMLVLNSPEGVTASEHIISIIQIRWPCD